MLKTDLEHIETAAEYEKILAENDSVMICCGRMGPMCIPVYKEMKVLSPKYPNIKFYDMDFDIPVAVKIKSLPQCANFMGLPFTVYFKKGKVVAATTSIQNKSQITKILDTHFA